METYHKPSVSSVATQDRAKSATVIARRVSVPTAWTKGVVCAVVNTAATRGAAPTGSPWARALRVLWALTTTTRMLSTRCRDGGKKNSALPNIVHGSVYTPDIFVYHPHWCRCVAKGRRCFLLGGFLTLLFGRLWLHSSFLSTFFFHRCQTTTSAYTYTNVYG